LAQEESLLDRADELGPTLVLWRNDPCVVIGRHQNPWVECDLRKMKADALPLVRRTSGGGAVYHDGGNTNFSFIAPSDAYDQERHFRVVIAGLAALGIDAWKTERNDLRVGERKISGNAFRHTKGRSLHHGTLLVHADLDLLTAYLSPRDALIETKATASVRSRVTNLADHRPGLTHEELWDALEEAFARDYGAGTPGAPQPPDPNSPVIRARAAELASWEWCYGHTPSFVRRMTLGSARGHAQIALTVKKGVIVAVESENSTLSDTLLGARYDAQVLTELAADAGPLRSVIEEIARGLD
ncbi:MAG: lipoate--protein ligase family protein, partial [Spirochaetota bacterium]